MKCPVCTCKCQMMVVRKDPVTHDTRHWCRKCGTLVSCYPGRSKRNLPMVDIPDDVRLKRKGRVDDTRDIYFERGKEPQK